MSTIGGTAPSQQRTRHTGLVLDAPTRPDDLADDRHPLLRDPVRSGFLAILVISLAVRWAVLKDGYFLTDDFMLTTRAVENDFGWSYLGRVHTGHFEPIGFAVMWVLAHTATLDWPVTVALLVVAQLVLSVAVWRLLTELFGRRALTLAPFGLFCFSTLTLPAFSWLSAAIIWVPLMLATAGLLRQHTRYLRTLDLRHAVGAALWLVVGMLSFEKVLVLLPYIVAFTFVVVPALTLRRRTVASFLRQTWPLWVGYTVVTLGYLAVYLPAANRSDMASSLRAPGIGTLGEFGYRTVLQTFVPGAVGGPWDWTAVSRATAIVSSPRAFEWTTWVVAAAVIGVSLVLRRRALRAWVSLGVYLLFSILALGVSRVPIIGSVAGLETRYVADAVVPLVVTLGFCLLPLRDEADVWYRTTLGMPADTFRRVVRTSVGGLLAVVLALSLHAMSGYATFHAANPHRSFVETARTGIADLPANAQVYDTGLPVDVVGPLFLEYDRVSRFLAPFATPERRAQLYHLTEYTNPYLLGADGSFSRMKVEGIASPKPVAGSCGWSDSNGTVTVPLGADVFAWTWAVRVGYLADSDTTATLRLGKGTTPVTLHKGLGEVYTTVTGGGREVTLTGLAPTARVCVGDVVVGNPIADR